MLTCLTATVPESTPTVPEVRFHKDRRYEFIFNRVSWDEADRVCHKKGGYLTIIDDMEEAYFLTNSSELHDTWIGASRKRGHPWYWTHTGEMLNTNVTDNAVDLFANRPQRIGYDCFNLFRDKNNKPLFVDRRCAQRFGFICEEVSEPQPIIELNSFRGRYYLFSSHLATWDDAVATCNRNGSYLAIVDDVEEAKFIVNASRYFHDTWVGGHRTHDGQWEWTHTGQEVPGPNDSRAFLRWINNLIRPNLDCVNIYRDSGNRPYFLERSCQEKHAFVCEEELEKLRLSLLKQCGLRWPHVLAVIGLELSCGQISALLVSYSEHVNPQ
uniref:C-type lectin domain-containing protein n=1 Tax=Timema poppense TaxID=170557 RepID=A0A7R9DQ50_TIMPO|nr:unnamed protein product [Timema poppensis]